MSSGNYITLGLNEKIDVEYLLTYLSNNYHFSKFILWGRSMGASTSLLIRHPLLFGRIIDSPYSSIFSIFFFLAKSLNLSNFLIYPLFWLLKINILDIADFNLLDINPLEFSKNSDELPLLHGHAFDDDFIPISQSKDIFQIYKSNNKEFIELKGGHNGKRSLEWIKKS